MPLSILHLSLDDGVGGSGRAAHRVHEGLRRLGHTSRMLVGTKAGNDADVRPIAPPGPLWALDRAARLVQDRLSRNDMVFPTTQALGRHPWFRAADVAHLYASHGGWFGLQALPRLSRTKAFVWRMSDMWALTGHCAFSYDCVRWKTGCGECPQLSGYPALREDTTARLWNLKDRVYRRSSIHIVAPTQWMAAMVRESPLLGRFPVTVIPNGLDTDVFRPMDKAAARRALGLPENPPLLLFGAHSLREARKGGAKLLEALPDVVSRLPDLQLAVVGHGGENVRVAGAQVHPLGVVRDDHRLAAVYAAADAFVLPTLADNLPNGVLEAMACGTPAVSTRVGGVPEAVEHGVNGRLANAGDPADLAKQILAILADPAHGRRLGEAARQRMVQHHGLELQARRFLSVYEAALAAA